MPRQIQEPYPFTHVHMHLVQLHGSCTFHCQPEHLSSATEETPKLSTDEGRWPAPGQAMPQARPHDFLQAFPPCVVGACGVFLSLSFQKS